MKKTLINGIVAGVVLLVINFLAVFLKIWLFTDLAKEYYGPAFNMQGYKGVLFLMHPFIVSFALVWFWERFKSLFKGAFWLRGLEAGLVYGVVAVLPSMWMIFSAFAVSLTLVFSWLAYGFMQGIVAGILYAKISP